MSETDEDVIDDLVDEEEDSEDEEVVLARCASDPDSRRRVEQKLEELRLRRMTQDFDFDD